MNDTEMKNAENELCHLLCTADVFFGSNKKWTGDVVSF